MPNFTGTTFHCPHCTFHGPESSVDKHLKEEHGHDPEPEIMTPPIPPNAKIVSAIVRGTTATAKLTGLNSLGPEWVPFALQEASLHAHKALLSFDADDLPRAKSRARVALGHLTAALEIMDKGPLT